MNLGYMTVIFSGVDYNRTFYRRYKAFRNEITRICLRQLDRTYPKRKGLFTIREVSQPAQPAEPNSSFLGIHIDYDMILPDETTDQVLRRFPNQFDDLAQKEYNQLVNRFERSEECSTQTTQVANNT